jgi:hypothetical protein
MLPSMSWLMIEVSHGHLLDALLIDGSKVTHRLVYIDYILPFFFCGRKHTRAFIMKSKHVIHYA